jgi:N-acetyltransferase
MPLEIRAVPLAGAGVKLEPLAESHREGLRLAGDAPEIWTHMPTPAIGAKFDPWFDWSLEISARGKEAVWAARNERDGELVGSTRYMNIEAAHARVEIGHTWYRPALWATNINPACKFLLLRHAFETLALNRVEFKTDIRNTRSQAAIAKLGAVREGVFRSHMIRADGTLRDTVYFAVIKNEWPRVRENLSTRLNEFLETTS